MAFRVLQIVMMCMEIGEAKRQYFADEKGEGEV